MSEDSLLERVTTAADERHLSQNTLTAYRGINSRSLTFPNATAKRPLTAS